MRKLISYIAVIATVFLLQSCANQLSDDIAPHRTEDHRHPAISMNAAKTMASNLYNSLHNQGSAASRSESDSVVAIEDVYAILWSDFYPVSRSAGDVSERLNDTALYVINMENNAGSILIDANDPKEPFLAILDEGGLTKNRFRDLMRQDRTDFGFQLYMDFWYDIDYNGLGGGTTPPNTDPDPIDYIYGWTVYEHYEPKLITRWGQGYTEESVGQFCPNYITGCTATATAQILSYFKTPGAVRWFGNMPGNGYGEGFSFIEWDKILLICGRNLGKFDPNFHTEYISQIAHLMRYLGSEFQMEYGRNNSSAKDEKVYAWFKSKNIGRISSYVNYSDNIFTALKDGAVAFGSGLNRYSEGHAWVYDGYMVASKDDNYQTAQKLIHCNWGYDGKCNGYFKSKVFKLAAAEIPDYGSTQGNINDEYTSRLKYFTIEKY